MKLLEQTIKELKGEEIEDDVRASVNMKVDFRVDETYIPDMNQRLTVYRRMAGVRTEQELDRLMDEVRDRYGPPPESVLNLAEYASIRLLADQIRVESIDREGQLVVLKFRADARLDPTWLFRVIQEREDVLLLPPATLRLDLKASTARETPVRRPVPGPTPPKAAIRWREGPGGRREPRPARWHQASRKTRSCVRQRKTRAPKAGCSRGSAACSES